MGGVLPHPYQQKYMKIKIMEIFDLKNEQMMNIIDTIEENSSITNEVIIMYHHYEDVIVSYYSNYNKHSSYPNNRHIHVNRKWYNKENDVVFDCSNDNEMNLFRQWLYWGFSREFYEENLVNYKYNELPF